MPGTLDLLACVVGALLAIVGFYCSYAQLPAIVDGAAKEFGRAAAMFGVPGIVLLVLYGVPETRPLAAFFGMSWAVVFGGYSLLNMARPDPAGQFPVTIRIGPHMSRRSRAGPLAALAAMVVLVFPVLLAVAIFHPVLEDRDSGAVGSFVWLVVFVPMLLIGYRLSMSVFRRTLRTIGALDWSEIDKLA